MAGLTTGAGNVGYAAGNTGSKETYGGTSKYGTAKYNAVEIQLIFRRNRRRRYSQRRLNGRYYRISRCTG